MKRLLLLAWLLSAALLPVPVRAELPDPVRFSVVLELGDLAQVGHWLDGGLDPNFEGSLIGTGLMIGAWSGNIPLMELFYARGADLQHTNRFGETALMLAAWKNQPQALAWLLERGAKPNRPEREWTALHYATFAGHAPLVDTLLAAGADINARSTNGSTVVMMAAREGHRGLAEHLLAAGANPALRNDYDDDAVSWAMRQNNFDIARLFTSAENYAELVRQATTPKPSAAATLATPKRSLPAPDAVDELLRMARLAETRGHRDEALTVYRRALTELKAREAEKVGAGATAKDSAASAAPIKGIVIRAKRARPDEQSLNLQREPAAAAIQPPARTLTDKADSAADRLLAAARAAEQAGQRAEAVRLFREAAAQIKSGSR